MHLHANKIHTPRNQERACSLNHVKRSSVTRADMAEDNITDYMSYCVIIGNTLKMLSNNKFKKCNFTMKVTVF